MCVMRLYIGVVNCLMVLGNKLYCIVFVFVFVFELDAILHRVCDKIRKIRIGLFATLQLNSTYTTSQSVHSIRIIKENVV